MKIKNVSCTQFAGIRDRDISFSDGINVVYGKNESGKSTLVNLISRTLFQNAKIDRRTDKEFRELYFPATRKGSLFSGDYIDGVVSFETDDGAYKLTKEWGSDSSCKLSTPDGVIRDQSTIDAILSEALVYGEGVYTEMLFSSQRNTDVSLSAILDASKKTDAKQELVDAVSMAFAQSDGISVDAIEQAIKEKIDEIAGKHWDFVREQPVRKMGRWSNGLGEILKAYYALEDAKAILTEISRLQDEADRAASDYAAKDTAVRLAEEAYTRFGTFASRLESHSERKKTVERLEKEMQKIEDILLSWPRLSDSLQKAKALQTEKSNRQILDVYDSAKKYVDEIAAVDSSVLELACPSDSEIMQVRTAQRGVATLENKLCGINLSAAVKMFSGNTIEITSLRTGEEIAVSDSAVAITEAVKITVPGVMEMQLSPADVNVSEIEEQLAVQRAVISSIFTKYDVHSLEELEQLAKKIADAKAKVDTAESKLSMLLGATSFEELEAVAREITAPVRDKAQIERDIIAVCGSADVSRFVTAKETIADSYAAEHGSINDLKAKAFDLDAELRKAKESIAMVEDIPAEYVGIVDPQAHLVSLQRELKLRQDMREAALNLKTSSASKLEGYTENIFSDPADEFDKAQKNFDKQKTLLNHWLHISEVFKELKEDVHDNPMQDIALSFAKYLAVISAGKISSEFTKPDKLDMNIYSDSRLLDYSKLSEGTKETVSLAFRLAVLDHLFPDGGGVIVLDDPFTDMDAERTAQSCELLKECAQRHQVIFLTCKEDYIDMLNGNNICI